MDDKASKEPLLSPGPQTPSTGSMSRRRSGGGATPRRHMNVENATWGYVALILVVVLLIFNAYAVMSVSWRGKEASDREIRLELQELATEIVALQNRSVAETLQLRNVAAEAAERYDVLTREEQEEKLAVEALRTGDHDRHRQLASLRAQVANVMGEVDAMNEKNEVSKWGPQPSPLPNDEAGGGGSTGEEDMAELEERGELATVDPDPDFKPHVPGAACVPVPLMMFGVTEDVHESLIKSIKQWPSSRPWWAASTIERKVNALEWSQELYVRMLRVLYWRQLLPIDFQRGKTRGRDMRYATLNSTFFPHVASRREMGTGGKCLVWKGAGADLVKQHLSEQCLSIEVVDPEACNHGPRQSGAGLCADPESAGAGKWEEALASHGEYSLIISVFEFQKYKRPWEVSTRLLQAVKEGGHLILALPSITQNSDVGPSYHRWTIEGAKSMVENAGFCVLRVVPLSNIALTVAGLLGYTEEDFTPGEHSFTDPVAPHGVAVVATRCKESYSLSADSSNRCCRYWGAGIRKVIDCWRGLYGQKNEKSAHDWGCTRIEELQFHTWGDSRSWYQMDWSANGVRAIPGFEKRVVANPRQNSAGEFCHSELLKYFGFTERMEREMAKEMSQWPKLPAVLSGGLKRKTRGAHLFHELFLRMHRVMYWKQLVPMDINMGWQRGSPLDRVYLERVFMDELTKRGLPRGSCLEWGNTYMAKQLSDLCPHQYEITEQTGPCDGKHGQFKSVGSYQDYRPFHVQDDNSSAQKFVGGYCADIHATKGIIPDNFFDLVISTYVFEHLHSPWVAMRNLFDMTALGGYMLWAAPNMEIYHANPGDFWRYPPKGAYQLVKDAGFCVIKVVPCSNTAVTAGFFMGTGDNDWTIKEHTYLDPVGPHTTAVLAMKPVTGSDCPPYEGIDLGDLQDCWRGDTDHMTTERFGQSCKIYTARRAGWDGAPWNKIDHSDASDDVRIL